MAVQELVVLVELQAPPARQDQVVPRVHQEQMVVTALPVVRGLMVRRAHPEHMAQVELQVLAARLDWTEPSMDRQEHPVLREKKETLVRRDQVENPDHQVLQVHQELRD